MSARLFVCLLMVLWMQGGQAEESLSLAPADWTASDVEGYSTGTLTSDNSELQIQAGEYRGEIRYTVGNPTRSFNLCNASLRIRFRVNGGGLYSCARFSTVLGRSAWHTTHNTWMESLLIPENTWLYIRFVSSAEKTYTWTTCFGDYDDAGGTVLRQTSGTISDDGWASLAASFILVSLGDNYSEDATLTLGEVIVESNTAGSAGTTDSTTDTPSEPDVPDTTDTTDAQDGTQNDTQGDTQDSTSPVPSSGHDGYASYDERLGVIFVPHVPIEDSAYSLALAPVSVSPFVFQLVDIADGTSGATCATFNTSSNVLTLQPICIGTNFWTAEMQLISTSPVQFQLQSLIAFNEQEIPFEGTTVLDITVPASENEQVVSDPASGIRIILPGGLLNSPAPVRLKHVTNQPLPFDGADGGYIVDINVGDQSTLAKPVILTFPLQSFNLPAGIQKQQIHVAHWREDVQAWEYWPRVVDLDAGTVQVQTNRLSPWAWFFSADDVSISSPKGYFTLYYDTDLTPSQYGYPDADIAALALRLGTYFDSAYDVYKAAGYSMPPTPQTVVLYRSTELFSSTAEEKDVEDPHYSSGWLGDDTIYFTLKKNPGSAVSAHDAAHELFHAIQNQALSSWSMWGRKWFVEAMADVAAFHIVGRRAGAPLNTLNTGFFTQALTTTDSVHEYQAAHFVDYLVQIANVDMKGMWDAVAASTIMPTLDVLNAHLHASTGIWLSQHWNAFCMHAFTGTHAIFSTSAGTNAFPLVERSTHFTLFGATETKKTWICQLPAGLSARSWGIRAAMPTNATERTFIIRPLDGIPSDVTIAVYRVQDYQTRNTSELLGALTNYETDPKVQLRIDSNDAIFVLVTYTKTSLDASGVGVRIALQEKSDLRVSLPSNITVSKSTPVKIQPTITGGTEPYSYRWIVGGNVIGTASTLEASYSQIAANSPVRVLLTVEDADGNTETAETYVAAIEGMRLSFQTKQGYDVVLTFKEPDQETHTWVTETEYSRTYDVFEVTLPQYAAGYHIGPIAIKIETPGENVERYYLRASHTFSGSFGMCSASNTDYYAFSSDYYYALTIIPTDDSKSLETTYLHIKSPDRE